MCNPVYGNLVFTVCNPLYSVWNLVYGVCNPVYSVCVTVCDPVYMLNCKINSTNGGTFSKSAGKFFWVFFLVQGA